MEGRKEKPGGKTIVLFSSLEPKSPERREEGKKREAEMRRSIKSALRSCASFLENPAYCQADEGLPPPLAHSRFTGTFSVRAKADRRRSRRGRRRRASSLSSRCPRGDGADKSELFKLRHLWRRFRLRPRGRRDGKENHRREVPRRRSAVGREWRVAWPPPCCKWLQVAVQWRRRRRRRKG